MTKLVAVVFEDGKAIRAFDDKKCIYSAYHWSHRHFCLSDYEPDMPLHKLPDWLEVKVYMMTEEQLQEIIK